MRKVVAPIEKRKNSPLTRLVFFLIFLLLLGEGILLAGVLDLNASTVEHYAPWAYEPFLRIIGEHPANPPRIPAVVVEDKEKKPTVSTKNATGLSDGLIPILIKKSPVKEKTIPPVTITNAPPSETNAPAEKESPIQSHPIEEDPVG